MTEWLASLDGWRLGVAIAAIWFLCGLPIVVAAWLFWPDFNDEED